MPYRDPIVAARARSAQHVANELPAVDGDPADDFSFEVTADEPTAPAPPKRTRVVVALLLAPLVAAASVALIEWHREPAAAAPPRLDTTFAVEVVLRTGDANAHTGDRCTVDLHLAREGECRVDVICPGIEKHSSTPACPMPALDSRIEAHWDGIDFDGELLSFDADGSDERGRITARVDAWRHGR